MSIASEIQRLSGVRSDIFTSITNKGVTVPSTATLSSCPTLIDSITTGGGPATSMINDGFTSSGFVSGYRPFTATQNLVPLYDEFTGTCISGKINDTVFIQVPTSALSSASDLTEYRLFISAQAWDIDQDKTLSIVPNSAYIYQNAYRTDVNTNFFFRKQSYTPPMYYYPFTQEQFISYWQDIQSQPWIATAYTGEYVYIGWDRAYQEYENMGGVWSYSSQTGTDIPYPSYPTTTTGFITNEFSGKESFTGTTNKVPNIYVSGFKNVVYDESPEGGATAIYPTSINLTSFSSNMLKNKIIAVAQPNYNANSTAYSYSYGNIQSAYSGFEGV